MISKYLNRIQNTWSWAYLNFLTSSKVAKSAWRQLVIHNNSTIKA